ncbi:MAG: hypothetical protein AB1724_13585 [Thermodesulfobacteriota bacterium]
MKKHRDQHDPGVLKTVLAVIAVLLLAAGLYYGYREMTGRHNREVSDLERDREQLQERLALMEQKISESPQALPGQESPAIPEDRAAEVFGRSPEESAADRCETLKNQIRAFFVYLDGKDYVRAFTREETAYQFYIRVFQDLSAHLPIVTGETRDIVTLVRNSAHFFKVLGKERVLLVKSVLSHEGDILESALANFHELYMNDDCCRQEPGGCPSRETLYEYAGFFLNTLSGKSYLMRRESVVRALVTYYSVLILDRASDEKKNTYGIDIRPHIDISMDDIGSQSKLVFQEKYLDTLRALKAKYQQAYPPGKTP